jgi:hypothetical protein
LVWLGLPPAHPAAKAGCERLWEWQRKWRLPETCIVSMLVRLTAAHGYHAQGLDGLVDYLLSQQLDDGGWNCAARNEPDKHSSFHTSIQALEALNAYQRVGGADATKEAQTRGRDFFLQHHLYKSHRIGLVAIRSSTRFPSCPSGTSTCCAGWSTSPTPAPTRTNGCGMPLLSCGGPVEPMAGGRRTPVIPAAHGSGWRNRVRAGGIPRECCAS